MNNLKEKIKELKQLIAEEKRKFIEEQRKNQKPTLHHHGFINVQKFNKRGELISEVVKHVTVCGVMYDNAMRIGVAICSEKDTFSREKGRNHSRMIAHQKPTDVIFTTPETSRKDLIAWFENNYQVMERVDDNGEVVFQQVKEQTN